MVLSHIQVSVRCGGLFLSVNCYLFHKQMTAGQSARTFGGFLCVSKGSTCRTSRGRSSTPLRTNQPFHPCLRTDSRVVYRACSLNALVCHRMDYDKPKFCLFRYHLPIRKKPVPLSISEETPWPSQQRRRHKPSAGNCCMPTLRCKDFQTSCAQEITFLDGSSYARSRSSQLLV